MKGRWYVAALSAVTGITAAFVHLHWLIALVIAAVVFGLGLWKKQRLPIFCSFAFFLAFGNFLYVDHSNETTLSPSQSDFFGKIVSLPELDGDHLTFQMKLQNTEKVRVSYYLHDKQQVPGVKRYRYGMMCRFSGELKEPSAARNFYGFDFRQFLYQQHIHWQLTPDELSRFSCINGDYSLYDRLQQWRGSGIRWIEMHFPKDTRGIAEALLFGERKDVSENVLNSYQDLGVIHLLAVSGLHVGLVVSALYLLLIRIGMTKERSLELLLFVVPLYIVMTGAAPSAVRAGFMAMVVLVALRFKRRLHALDGISWVALFMLAVNPYVLFQVGFQLSFLISFTLIVSAPYIQSHYETRLAQLIAVSVISQLIALPILLYRFYGISILSLPFNLMFIPFISLFVLPVLFIAFFTSIFAPLLAQPLLSVLDFAIRFSHGLLVNIDSLQWGMLVFGKPSLSIVFLLYVVIFYGLMKWEGGGGRCRFVKPTVALVAVCLFQWVAPYLSESGEVTMLDVGQGDSILIELPHRKAVYLIDTGGTLSFGEQEWQKQNHAFDVGKDVVLQELKARGIRKLDRLILTHGDEDHIGGAAALLGHVRIKEMLYGKGPITKPFVKELLTHASALGIPIIRVGEGMGWKVDGATFSILNPSGSETGNSRSIVIAARLGELRWLFTGDLEKEGERRLIDDYPNLKVDVLKAGHHGSKTSTSEDFLRMIRPRLALISVGEHNLYGHPSPEVIERLKENKVKVLRTDQRGAIRFRYGGGKKRFDWVIKQ
jgi:competence protein ComEC